MYLHTDCKDSQIELNLLSCFARKKEIQSLGTCVRKQPDNYLRIGDASVNGTNVNASQIKLYKVSLKRNTFGDIVFKMSHIFCACLSLLFHRALMRSGPTFARVMAYCLTASNLYLNQCWLEIVGIHPSAITRKMLKTYRLKLLYTIIFLMILWIFQITMC